MNGPATYNDDLIAERARAVYYKALSKIEEALDGKAEVTSERLHAYAASAEAAANGFSPEDGDGEY